jgi:hypothetical protein
MGFKWATEFCSSAHFIITTDDDVYVNINGLFRTLLIHDSSLKTSVAGICEMGPLRDTNPSSKWYVSPREYLLSITMLNIQCVVLIIYTKTPST